MPRDAKFVLSLTVFKGRHLHIPGPGESASGGTFVEVRFGGRSLKTQPVAGDEPTWNADFRWELTEKQLQTLRLSHASIKAHENGVRASLGHIVVCLRDIEVAARDQGARSQPRWEPLLCARAGTGPQLLVASRISAKPGPASRSATPAPAVPSLEMLVNVGDGKESFELAACIEGVRFPERISAVVPASGPAGLYAYLTLFDSPITTRDIVPDVRAAPGPAEPWSALFRVRGSPRDLAAYFANASPLRVFLCSGREAVAGADLDLKPLSDACTRVEGTAESGPVGSVKGADEVCQCRRGILKCVGIFVSAGTELENEGADAGTDVLGEEQKKLEVPKEDAEPSLDASDASKSASQELQLPSIDEFCCPQETREPDKMPKADPAPAAPDESQSTRQARAVPVAVPAYDRSFHLEDAEELRHIRFSVELVRIRGVLSGPGGLKFRYCYAPFGSGAPVETFRPVLPPCSASGDIAIPDSFTAFEFSMSPTRLASLLRDEPLMIEVVTSDGPGAPDRQVGVVTVSLDRVLCAKKISSGLADAPVRAATSWCTVCAFDSGASVDALPRKAGSVLVALALEDLGPAGVDTASTIAAAPGALSSIDLEMWKQAEQERMAAELQAAKDAACARLEKEFEQRERAQLSAVSERVREREQQLIRLEDSIQERRQALHAEQETKMRDVEEAVKRMRDEWYAKESALLRRVDTIEAEKKELEDALAARSESNASLQRTVFQLQQAAADSPVSSLKAELAMSNDKRKELEERVRDLTDELQLRKGKLVRALQEIARMKDDGICRDNDEKQRLREEITVLKQQLDARGAFDEMVPEGAAIEGTGDLTCDEYSDLMRVKMARTWKPYASRCVQYALEAKVALNSGKSVRILELGPGPGWIGITEQLADYCVREDCLAQYRWCHIESVIPRLPPADKTPVLELDLSGTDFDSAVELDHAAYRLMPHLRGWGLRNTSSQKVEAFVFSRQRPGGVGLGPLIAKGRDDALALIGAAVRGYRAATSHPTCDLTVCECNAEAVSLLDALGFPKEDRNVSTRVWVNLVDPHRGPIPGYSRDSRLWLLSGMDIG
eukprot:m51a1_g11038 putative centrosomal protein of 120 kda (1072) ;mRNA; f:433913-439277